MNMVDTTNRVSRRLLGALLLLFLVTAPTELLAQDAPRAKTQGPPEQALFAPPGKQAPTVSPQAGSVLLEEGFETFSLGDVNGQQGWFGQFVNWTINTDNPSSGSQHFRGLSDGLGQTLSLSPQVPPSTEATSTATAFLDIQGSGVTWEFIPQSPTAGFVNTRVRFNPNGSIDALESNAGTFVSTGASTPSGYFELSVVVNTATSDFEIFIDGTSIFSGLGFAPDVEQIALLSQMEVQGPTFDMDDLTILDGALVVNADLSVSKGLDVNEGQTGSYHIAVTNNGPEDATGVYALDTLPGAITVTGWSETQGTFDPFTGLWDVGSLANGASAELWIDVTFNAQGSYTNEVEVWADQDDPDTSNNDDEVSVVMVGDRIVPDFVPESGARGTTFRGDRFVADLLLDKSVDNDAPTAGDEVTYTISVLNQGPHSTAKVEVTDKLPECLTFVSATADRGSYDETSSIWTLGKLKVGETSTLSITASTENCSGEVINTAEVTKSSLPDPDDQFNIFDQQPEEDEIDTAVINVTARALGLDGSVYALGGNYPNPFNPTTVVPYSLPEAAHVSLKVYDLLGRAVSVLVEGPMPAGVHEAVFEASSLPTGMYLVRLEAAGVVKTLRVTLMK